MRTDAIMGRTVRDGTCLRWIGAHTRQGYALANVEGRVRELHRVVYEFFVGPIPDGLVIDHVRNWGCRHRDCLNVAHMEPVTQAENCARRSTGYCIRGHEFTPENSMVSRRSKRTCRACHNARQAAYYARKKIND
jgi:hypothetical protein